MVRSLVLDPNDPILHPLRLGANQFPGAWAYTMPKELRGLRMPDERRATCMNCPKSCYEDYRNDYRCCTYHPRIPNYLLGLNMQTPGGEAALETIMKRGLLLPEGMHHSPGQWYDYLDDLENENFGKSVKVLCPMLDESNGYCRAHAFRNSVCSTFFCLKDHGNAGDEFWSQIQTLGTQVEMSLAQWALRVIGFDIDTYFKKFTALADEVRHVSTISGWKEHVLDQLWGSWRGREKELMLECGLLAAEHRDDLWEIANNYEIQESAKFNISMIKAVPDHLQGQVDPEDLEEDDEDSEAAKPRDIWKQCTKAYEKLWDLPEGHYAIGGRVEIVPNHGIDKEALYHEGKPYSIRVYTRKGSRTLDWRMFIDQAEYDLLQLFKEGRTMDWTLLLHPSVKALGRGKEFIAEMLESKVLVREALH